MNPRKRKNVEKGLEKKGFWKNHADHRKFICHKDTGEKTAVWTKTSHGSSHKDISPNNLRKMEKQCNFDNVDFERLLDCPLSREDYQLRGETFVTRKITRALSRIALGQKVMIGIFHLQYHKVFRQLKKLGRTFHMAKFI